MSLDSPAPPIPPPTQDSHRSPANLAPASTASTNHDAATTGSRTRSGSRRSAASVTHQPATRGRGRLAVTSKFAACWSGDQPLGSQFQIRGGLVADFSNPPFRTFLTGTVRQIAITSNSSKLGERNGREAWHPDGPWELQDVPVAPLTFVHHRRAGTRARARVARSPGADHPRRRCQEIKQISGEHAQSYARRHLRETGHDRTHWIVGYLCLVTDLTWQLKHREMPDGWRLPSLARLDSGQSPSASPKTVSTRRQGRSPQCR